MTRADQIPDETLLDDAEVMLDRAGMAVSVDEIARYQRVAEVVRAYVALRREHKALEDDVRDAAAGRLPRMTSEPAP